jgi:hypothetical protein
MSTILEHIKTATYASVPQVKVAKRGKYRVPWIGDSERLAIQNKKNAWKQYRHNPTANHLSLYKTERNFLANKLKLAQEKFELSLSKQLTTNPKLFFNYAKLRRQVRNKVPPVLSQSGVHASSDLESANTLNSFFASVFTKSSLEPIDLRTMKSDNHMFVISEVMVRKKLAQLNVHKAVGPDSVSNLVLKKSIDILSKPLAYLFRCSITSGDVPVEWLKANVTPIYKTGKPDLPTNYRPVSLSSCICKVMETIVKDFLLQWINVCSPLNNSQHGFRMLRSCTSQLLEYVDDITVALNKRLFVDVIYTDFSKAFDRVSHNVLIQKLLSRHAPFQLVCWIRNFLSNRIQRVVLGSTTSDWVSVTSGVPQGTILGPLLFSIYIDDVDNILTKGLVLKKFADDTKLYTIFNNTTSTESRLRLQTALNALESWCSRNFLPLNVQKCNIVHFGRKNPNYEYHVNNSVIRSVDCVKDLGVLIDSSISFSQHVDSVASTARRLTGLVFRTIRSRRRDVLLPVYTTLVRPCMEYATAVWNPHLIRNVQALEKVQRRFTKRISGMRYKSYTDRLLCLKLPSLSLRRIYFDLVHLYKILNGHLVSSCSIMRKRNVYVTRGHQFAIEKQSARLDCRKYFFSSRVVDHWNALPNTVVNAITVAAFKIRLRQCMNLTV